jgi:hypothetical protein
MWHITASIVLPMPTIGGERTLVKTSTNRHILAESRFKRTEVWRVPKTERCVPNRGTFLSGQLCVNDFQVIENQMVVTAGDPVAWAVHRQLV